MKDILIYTGTWCFLYIMLCFRNINVQRKIYSEFLFLILFISFIISYFLPLRRPFFPPSQTSNEITGKSCLFPVCFA